MTLDPGEQPFAWSRTTEALDKLKAAELVSVGMACCGAIGNFCGPLCECYGCKLREKSINAITETGSK